MKWLMLAITLTLLSTLVTARRGKSHRDLVQECAEYGRTKLSSFKQQNPTQEGIGDSFEYPRQKKTKSGTIEDDAVFHLAATKQLITETGRCLSNLQTDPAILSLWQEIVGCKNFDLSCDATSPYRTANGSCNNLMVPELGMAFTPQSRFVDAHYEDGVDYPREYDLPSPRLISNTLFATETQKKDSVISGELMAWGQLLAHDFILTPLIDEFTCCTRRDIYFERHGHLKI